VNIRSALIIATCIIALGASEAPAHDRGRVTCDSKWTVFAEGLDNPRHMRVGPDGLLYVAEAGLGGTALATCEPADNMFTVPGPYMGGLTGRLTRFHLDGRSETVAEGIASFIDGTLEVLGTSDMDWIGRTLYVLTEGGGCTRGLPNQPAGIVRVNHDRTLTYVADITRFILENPVANEPLCGPLGDCEPDGVPHSMAAVGPYLYVVETNHNSILKVNPRTGEIRRLHDLSVADPAPIRIVRSGDRALIGTFDGDILELSLRRSDVKFVQSGFNPLVDLAFIRGRLHLLEPFTVPWTPGTGRVIRRGRDGAPKDVVTGLTFPMGLAEWHGDLFISNNSFGQGGLGGGGQLLKIDCRGRRRH
jgi:hypothetical protein